MLLRSLVSTFLGRLAGPGRFHASGGVAFIFCSMAGAALGAEVTPQTALPALKQLSLEQLMDVEVTSVSKKEQRLADTAAAIYVITQEEIHRSGVTTIPEAFSNQARSLPRELPDRQ